METVAIILSRFILLAIGAVQLAMFLRMILSLLGMEEEGGLGAFLLLLTEPILLPVRLILGRIRALEGVPLDLSFIVTYLLLSLLSYSLPIVG